GADRARLPRPRPAARLGVARRALEAGQGQPARALAGACCLRVDRGDADAPHLHRRGGARRPGSQKDIQVNAAQSAAQSAPMTTPLVDVRNLSVTFRSSDRTMDAVKGISFNIAKGEIVALVGESGSGKTVSALSIMKLLPYPAASHPTGEIRFRGQDLLTA